MQPSLPFITIAIPAYRRVRYLRETLESVLRQNYPNYEVLVHDDDETGRVRVIVEEFGSDKIRYRHNDPPLGLVPKLNELVRDARGEWMLFLCDDDALEPGYLQAIGLMAAHRPDAALLRIRFRLVDEEGRLVRDDVPCERELSSYAFAARVFDIEDRLFTMNISGIAFRPRRLEALGGFRDYHRSFHSDCFAWFALGCTGPSLCDSQPLCRIRLHRDSLTMSDDADFNAMLDTELRMRGEVVEMLDNLYDHASGSEERRLAMEARRAFEGYFSKWLGPFDKAFEDALLSERRPWPRFHEIFETMRALNVPVYRRALVYSMLAPAPRRARRKALLVFSAYRNRRKELCWKENGLEN